MSIEELEATFGLPWFHIMEAVMVARSSEDLFIAFTMPARDWVRLGHP